MSAAACLSPLPLRLASSRACHVPGLGIQAEAGRQPDLSKRLLRALRFSSAIPKGQFLLWLLPKPFRDALHFLRRPPASAAIGLPGES